MTRINEVLYFVLYDLCKIKKTQNKSASVFSIGTPEWNRTTAHGSGGMESLYEPNSKMLIKGLVEPFKRFLCYG